MDKPSFTTRYWYMSWTFQESVIYPLYTFEKHFINQDDFKGVCTTITILWSCQKSCQYERRWIKFCKKTGYKLGATEILKNENKLNQTLKMRIRSIFNGEVAVTILTRSYLQISCSKPTHSNSKLWPTYKVL